MTESRLDSCRQDFKVQNRTSVSLPSTEGGAALPGGSEAQPTGTLRAKVPCHRGCRRTRPGCSLRAGTNRAGAGRAGALTASRPIAEGPRSPGGLGQRAERAAAAPTRERGAGPSGRAQSGGGSGVWTDRRAGSAALPAAQQPGPRPPALRSARHGVVDHLQAGGVSGLFYVSSSLPSGSPRSP